MKRLTLLFGLLLAVAGTLAACTDSKTTPAPAEAVTVATADLPLVTVYKSPTCGCCSKWVSHLEANGFRVEALDVDDMTAVKQRYGIPATLGSCHTAVVGDYVVEGHVPADLVHRMLKEKPTGVAGIAVPGMPIGSPGMEGPNPQPYSVIAFGSGGEWVYANR